MAIVWPTELDVDAYAELGREVVVPRLPCPGCRRPLRFWGWYERDVRVTAEVIRRLEVRRGHCRDCGRTHALLPGFVTWGRLDTVEVIGSALEAMCAGAGMRPVADGLDLKHTTVRDWRRRFAQRASLLAIGFCRYVVAVGDVVPRLSGAVEEVALGAIRSAWAAAGRRFGEQVVVLWRLANAVVGGHLLSTNMDPPWAAA
jgi:uncharacterized protein DUF6431